MLEMKLIIGKLDMEHVHAEKIVLLLGQKNGMIRGIDLDILSLI
jgi:hypothetical protein